MDNLEAIEFLKNMIDREAIRFVCPEREGDVAIWQYHVEALQMAISALQAQEAKHSTESSSTHKALDTISRQEAIDAFMTSTSDGDKADWCKWVLEQLPSVAKDTNVPCKDLISRQVAIDALDGLCDRECEYSKKQRHVMCGACHLGSAFDVIEQLPSSRKNLVNNSNHIVNYLANDTISRQAVIDIVNGYETRLNGYIGTNNDSEVYAYARGLLLSIQRNIDALPSAQPEPQWIPVSERLPEDGEECLVSIRYPNEFVLIDRATYSTDLFTVDKEDFFGNRGESGWYYYDREYGYCNVLNVIAWMPLPEPYAERRTDVKADKGASR